MPAGAIDHVGRTLAWAAGLLFLVAAVSWWRSGTSPLTLALTADAVVAAPGLRWWAGPLIAVAIASAVGCLLIRRLSVGWAMCAVVAYTLLLVAVGAAVWAWVLPEPHPFTALGPAVPATLLGFAVSLLACLLLALSLCLRGATGVPPSRPSRRSAVVTAAVALAVTSVISVAVVRLDTDYLLRSNEYWSPGDVDRPPGATYHSQLTGGSRWQLQVPGLRFGAVATRYGLAAVSGTSVVGVDSDTGAQRWRYARADSTGTPGIAALDGGQQVLVWWDPASPYVLDSRTGRRVAHWQWPKGQTVLLGDPLVVQRPIESGSSIVELTSSGNDRWMYPLSSCDHPYVVADGGMLLISILAICGSSHDHVLQVRADTGDVRWSTDGIGGRVVASTPRVALFATQGDQQTTLTALRLRDGSTAWRHPIEFPDGERTCDGMSVTAVARLTMFSCEYEVVDAAFNKHTTGVVMEEDLQTGQLLRRRVFTEGTVESVTIDAGGRRIITHDDSELGCILTHLDARRGKRFVVDKYDHCRCSNIQVIPRREQVILLDLQTETISSLR